jgi:hypothetical protein
VTPPVYSSNEFNVQVTSAIRRTWLCCFSERIQMTQNVTLTGSSDGGVDGHVWAEDKPEAKIAFRTFPSPSTRLRSSTALEILKGNDAAFLIVTRLPTSEWTRSAIEQSYPPPVEFLHWTGSEENKQALEASLRVLRDAVERGFQSP